MSVGKKSLSLPLAIGVGLLCFALSFALSSLVPAWEMQHKLSAQFEELSQKRASQSAIEPAAKDVPATQPEEAPEPEKLPPGGKLQKLQQLIASQGLNPESMTYRKEANVESGGVQYYVSVPLKTSYPVLRKLLEKMQSELPGIHLDKLTLQRTRASEQMLDAQLELGLRLAGAER